MKKTVRIMVLVMAVLTVVLVLASCGNKLSGDYATAVTTYSFSGSKVTIKGVTGEASGEYEIKDGKITITLDDVSGGIVADAMKIYEGTFDFEETDNGIKIAGVEYTKK